MFSPDEHCIIASSLLSFLHNLNDGRFPTDGQQISLRGNDPLHTENLHGAAIDRDDTVALINQHQAFTHVLHNRIKVGMGTGKIMHLLANLHVLPIHSCQQRCQLIVNLVLQRLVQIQLIDWLNDLPG